MSGSNDADRRRLFLGGTALAALGAVGLRGVQQAQVQAPPAAGGKPNGGLNRMIDQQLQERGRR
jgi:hypothetical protein